MFGKSIREQSGSGYLDHHPDRNRRESGDFLAELGPALLDQGAVLKELGERGDHREHECDRALPARTQNRSDLCLQPAPLVPLQVLRTQTLVASPVEGSKNDSVGSHGRDDAPIQVELLVLGRWLGKAKSHSMQMTMLHKTNSANHFYTAGNQDSITLPLLLYRALGSYRTGEAAVLALLLVGLCLALFLIIERVVGGRTRA